MTIILKDEGREIILPSKTAEIVRVIIEISAEIERLPSGHVAFHFKGRSVIPEVLRRFLPLKSEEPTSKV